MENYAFLKHVSRSCDEIYSAMDTNDTLRIVTAARNTMRRFYAEEKIWSVREHSKQNTKSKIERQAGNAYYKEGNYRKAIHFYNNALSLATDDSEEKVLAYSNRSAALFNISHYSACIDDIRTCLSMKTPRGLAEKLQRRLQDTKQVTHKEMISGIAQKCDSKFLPSLFKEFKCNTKNTDVPCAIEDITFIQDGVKCIKAKKDIKVGSIVAMEKAYVCWQQSGLPVTRCYHCNKITFHLHPCPGCTQALFCSNACRDSCMEEYHRIECQIIEYLMDIYYRPYVKLATCAAIKLSLKIGWEAFVEASQNIGANRMRTSSVRETYSSDEPVSILCYDDVNILIEGKLFSGSIYCAAILCRLELVPNYFPTELKKRKAATDAMSRVILHLYATFSNAVPILCSAFNYKSLTYTYGIQANYGWFSMCSKLKHSCEPNLGVAGLNDSVALIAMRTIKKGEDLTISYIGNFYDVNIAGQNRSYPFSRSIRIFAETRHTCHCRVCLQEWSEATETVANMTKEQTLMFHKLLIHNTTDYDSILRALDMFSWGTMQHKLACKHWRTMINIFQCSQTQNITYL